MAMDTGPSRATTDWGRTQIIISGLPFWEEANMTGWNLPFPCPDLLLTTLFYSCLGKWTNISYINEFLSPSGF